MIKNVPRFCAILKNVMCAQFHYLIITSDNDLCISENAAVFVQVKFPSNFISKANAGTFSGPSEI